MNFYTASPPPAADYRDVQSTALTNLPSPPDLMQISADHTQLTVGYNVTVLSPAQVTTFQNAVAGTVANPADPWVVNDDLHQKALTALTNNVAFLGLPHPVTNAQALAQIDALTRQNDGTIQLLLNLGTNQGT